MLTAPARLRTDAADRAAMNFALNRAAMGQTQPKLAGFLQESLPNLEFCFGRDGSLTARDEPGGWIEGCSLPLLAAREMLKGVQLSGRTGCFLEPVHAAQIRVALERIQPTQALAVLLTDAGRLELILACEDFSADILANRLWFCCGSELSAAIEELFVENPGLAVPSHFIKTVLLGDEPAQPLIRIAEAAFGRVNAMRQEQLRSMSRRPAAGSWCIIAPLAFRLWDDAGWNLAKSCDAFESEGAILFNPDDPAAASSLALAKASSDASAIIAPNLVRAEMPGVFPLDRPWMTWITGPRVGPFTAGAGGDAVLLADERWRKIAEEAGWPADRVHVATWPAVYQQPSDRPEGELKLVLMADVTDLKPPQAICDLSSQRLIWEQVAHELVENPFGLGSDPLRYLRRFLQRGGVAEESVNGAYFVNNLLVPAYQVGIARILCRAQFPLRLYGRGWADHADLAACWGGEMTERERFEQVVLDPGVILVDPMPAGQAHPIEALSGRRIGVQGSAAGLLQQASAALKGQIAAKPMDRRPISRALIQSMLG